MSTLNNSWVSSYLDALMSAGLSSEHAYHVDTTPPLVDESHGIAPGLADRSLCAKYYVHQILSLDEENIRGAWKRSLSAGPTQQSERDLRLEYLSWRVWAMKRKRQEVSAAHEREQRLVAEEEEETASLSQLASLSLADLTKISPTTVPYQQGASRRNLDALLRPLANADTWASARVRPPSPRTLSRASFGDLQSHAVDEESSSNISFQAHAGGSWQQSPLLSRTGSGSMVDMMDRHPRLYIVLISLHGLVRGKAMELGRDPDTGGQVKYVVELARALGRMPSVLRVDLLTRLVADPAVDASYSVPEEPLLRRTDTGDLGGAYIVRIPCGPPQTYFRKEELWPHVREFADRSIAYVSDMLSRLQNSNSGQSAELHVVHGHYADAGESAGLMAHTLGVDMVLTGHSLGRNKRDYLIKQGTMSREEIEHTYNMARRIEGEERALDAAMQVYTSTQEEIVKQWGLYDGFNAELAAALRNRPCKGYHVPDMLNIPPGLDFSNLKVRLEMDPWDLVLGPGGGAASAATIVDYRPINGTPKQMSTPPSPRRGVVEAAADALKTADLEQASAKLLAVEGKDISEQYTHASSANLSRKSSLPGTPHGTSYSSQHLVAEPAIWTEIGRFLKNPRKPVILTLCRADAKKNVAALIHAYGKNQLLREVANLVLILGNRDSIDGLTPGSASVITNVLKLIDRYDLYGSVAYPKHHQQAQVTDIYLLAAATKGVFVNPALQEPFGLTLIEAAAHGVPTVATKNGGPSDIIPLLKNGLLVDPTSHQQIGDAIVRIMTHPETWERFSASGRTNIIAYSWPSHCMQYLKAIAAEKAQPVLMPTLRTSLSGEDLTQIAAMEARSLSMPHTRHSTSHLPDLNGGPTSPRGLESSHHHDASTGSLLGLAASRGDLRMFVHDSTPADEFSGHPGSGCGVELMNPRPGGYVVFCADDEGDLLQVSQLLLTGGGVHVMTSPVGEPGGPEVPLVADGEATGYGMVTTLSFKEVQCVVGPARGRRFSSGSAPTAALSTVLPRLDFLVCLSGSQVWHQRADGGGWVCDESYETHIDFRWEPSVVRQVLKRLTSGPSGWGKLPVNKEGCSQLKVLAGGGPFNQQLVLLPPPASATSPADDSTTGSAPRTNQPAVDTDLLLARLRCKLRKSGIRTQLLASSCASGGAPQEAAVRLAGAPPPPSVAVRVTPLRSSRALALRYLAHRFKLDFACFTVVLFAVQEQGAGQTGTAAAQKGACSVALGSSDGADLVSGLQQVVLLPSPHKAQQDDACRFNVDLAAYAGSGRVRVLHSSP